MARFAASELSQLRVIRELGDRTPGTYLAQREREQFVLETYANIPPRTVRRIDACARRIQAIAHPHLVAVLAVERISGGVCVLSEWVDGVPVSEVFFSLSLGARVRVLIDILGALSELHGASGDGPIIHAGVLARSAFVTRGGLTKLGFAYRAPLCLGADAVAPEVLLADEADLGPHTDVYSAGVMLWEAIMGRPLFGDDPPERIVAAQLANRVPQVDLREADAWATSLVPVLERALAIEPSRRFPHVAAMAGELRLAARARLGLHESVGKQVFAQPPSGVQPVRAPVVAAAQSETRVLAAEPFVAEASEPPPPPAPAPPATDAVTAAPLAVPPPVAPPEPSVVGLESRRRPLRLGLIVAAAVVALATSLLLLLLRRPPATQAIAHDAAPPSVTSGAAPAPPERESETPAAPPPASARLRPATSASGAPAPPRPKHRRGSPYNPPSI